MTTCEYGQLPVLVINMDDDVERLATMREQLQLLDIEWERIPAVDGTALSPQVLRQDNSRARPRKLSASEIGCLQSHVTVWRRIVEGTAPAALVLEDDVLLNPDVALFVNTPSIFVDHDCIIRLETFGMPVVLGQQVANVHGRGLYPLRSLQYGTAAYIITRSRARILLNDYDGRIDTADRLMFCNPLRNRVYQLSPAPCIQHKRHAHRDSSNRIHSRLESEKLVMLRRSWREPLTIACRVTDKIRSLVGIGLDLARGYPLQAVPYSEGHVRVAGNRDA